MRNLEFHTDPRTGEAMYGYSGDNTLCQLCETDTEIIGHLLEESESFYPEQYTALCRIYRKSSANRRYYDFLRARRIVNCCFGENDSQPDIDEFGVFHYERVRCPIIAECPYYRIVCLPVFQTRMSEREKQVMEKYINGYKTDKIAAELSLSIHTVNNHRKNALRRLKLHSLAEFSRYACENKIFSNKPPRL